MEDENLAINLGLLEILHSVGMRRLHLSRHQHRLFDASDAPILIPDPATRNGLGLTLVVAQYPTIHHRPSIPVSLRVCLLGPRLKLEKEHWHAKAGNVASPQ
jgi:hypothetical protein